LVFSKNKENSDKRGRAFAREYFGSHLSEWRVKTVFNKTLKSVAPYHRSLCCTLSQNLHSNHLILGSPILGSALQLSDT
jgi:hypothetical protein